MSWQVLSRQTTVSRMTFRKGENRSALEEAAVSTAQKTTPSRTSASSRGSKPQVRHRASVACASCRDRRIRCVVPKGESECIQCKKASSECVIKNDDERRRPTSRAYMSSLSNRIAMLERMLLDNDIQPPPAAHPPKSIHETTELSKESDEQQKVVAKRSSGLETPSLSDSGNEDCTAQDGGRAGDASVTRSEFWPLFKEQSSPRTPEPNQENVTHRLLSTREHLSFDQLSGQLRYFGPTANFHVYRIEYGDQLQCRQPSEQVRRAQCCLRTLNSATHDYLMSNFWMHYDSALRTIPRESFASALELHDAKFYSSFLHVSILAMGFRFADPSREDVKQMAVGTRESSLHREARNMAESELERPGGIPSVLALLILGDLDCGVGRDNSGWMYTGMAIRLAFDIGLHVDCRDNGMSEQEVGIRRMVMRACVLYDKYWALFFGRPTSIKDRDVDLDLHPKRFSRPSSLKKRPGVADKADNVEEIQTHLVELMELSSRIAEMRGKSQTHDTTRVDDDSKCSGSSERKDAAYFYAIEIERQLRDWHRRLPEHLQWKSANIKHATLNYFLLHQQYHVSMVLLHRPWAEYGWKTGDEMSTGQYATPGPISDPRDASLRHHKDSPETNGPYASIEAKRMVSSRKICSFHAICIAKIFWQHRQRFDGTKIFITGVQHAGTAAIALIAASTYHCSEPESQTYLRCLEILASAISDMGQSYQPAACMENLLREVLLKLRHDIEDPTDLSPPLVTLFGSGERVRSSSNRRCSLTSTYSALPETREADASNEQPRKRRRPCLSGRRASEFSRPTLPLFTEQLHESRRRSSQSCFAVGNRPLLDLHASTTNGDKHEHFNLDFPEGSANEPEKASKTAIKTTETSILDTPPSGSWPIVTLDESPVFTSRNADFGYYELLGESASGTAGSGSSSTSGAQNSGRGGESAALLKLAASRPILGDQMNRRHTMTEEKNPSTSPAIGLFGGGTGWMGSEMDPNMMGSVSLGDLVQSSIADKVVLDRTYEAPRNHELDFMSF
ncbi:Nitrogen assimilation transcription factor nit-4 [Colletotrichum tanaceti]|uniref:Nitrogen assimilation transcription factor nit-4 n=1 Tax=Colletotrichum tanaceti TaxID=1306861 RepID=A0A4U6XPX4_9PEZI|nr:Nitrogen assimilation transcription factor nit-4 [Colletotrichum tanaceti]TKW57824.1 Nitrogen assimilation transcription factor nit-4 [Colletotrichum tanaceti]